MRECIIIWNRVCWTQPILDLCKTAERKRRGRVGMRWWEQAVLDLEGARDTAAAAAEADKDGMEE